MQTDGRSAGSGMDSRLLIMLCDSIAALASGVRLKVHTEHGTSGSMRREGLLKHRYLDRKSDYVIAVSPQVEIFLRGRWKPRCKVVTVLNGIELGSAAPGGRETCLKLIGAKPGDQVVGHVGRIAKVKDQSTLLRAFQIVHRRRKNCHLVIVGSGPLCDKLINEAKSLEISERVHFLGERDNVRDFLAIFDVFALSSISEGISIALLEAMAQGVVPVVTGVGGNSVVVRNGQNGFIVPVGNKEVLADRIIHVLENTFDLERVRRNAIDTVRSRFSIKRMVSASFVFLLTPET